jgi:hypothetical protein
MPKASLKWMPGCLGVGVGVGLGTDVEERLAGKMVHSDMT